uniref:molybdenum cofactor guanylyltransferase n=1 Tax=Thaumasiovibrio occultus TaxID=1891184 RepID=UPI00131E2E85|nr:molybdenum cofactor guanylyltransferase [Thaumasiovibrio occultus]
MGYRNKGLLPYQGKPLICWPLDIIDALPRQVMISANNDLTQYRALAPTFTDGSPSLIGPLGGILSAFQQTNHDWLGFIPCDMPVSSSTLFTNIEEKLTDSFDAVLYRINGRANPLFGAYHRRCLAQVEMLITEGNYRASCLADALDVGWVDVEDPTLTNVNYLHQLK